MQDDLPIYPIRTVASLTGVDARRLRSWESEYHLLEPARSKGGHRLYSPRDLRLVHLIRRLVDQEGMSLQGIKAFLAAQPDLEDGASKPSGSSSQGGSEPTETGTAPRTPGGGSRGESASTASLPAAAPGGRAPRLAGGHHAAVPAPGTVPLAARSPNGHGRVDRS